LPSPTPDPATIRLTAFCADLQKAQPQRVVRVECEGLHATVISRFIYDCAYFGKEVMAMTDAVMGTAGTTPAQGCTAPTPAYRTIFEVMHS